MIHEVLNNSRKIVIKIGSNTLSSEQGGINFDFFNILAKEISQLKKEGKQILIVSSGAMSAGVSTLGKWEKKQDIHYKQALSSIGQVVLMDSYRKAFAEYGLLTAQILLTKDDFSDENRTLHIRNTLFTLLDEGVIPIINENDTVSVEEIKIGDNDNLGALTANLWSADLLLILSDIDGVYNKDPRISKSAKLIEVIPKESHILDQIEVGEPGEFGTGGIRTKIEAAKKVNQFGIPMILVNGKKKNLLLSLREGKGVGTLFQA